MKCHQNVIFIIDYKSLKHSKLALTINDNFSKSTVINIKTVILIMDFKSLKHLKLALMIIYKFATSTIDFFLFLLSAGIHIF